MASSISRYCSWIVSVSILSRLPIAIDHQYADARIIPVSSIGIGAWIRKIYFEDLNYDKDSAWFDYGHSKLAVLLLIQALARK